MEDLKGQFFAFGQFFKTSSLISIGLKLPCTCTHSSLDRGIWSTEHLSLNNCKIHDGVSKIGLCWGNLDKFLVNTVISSVLQNNDRCLCIANIAFLC